jgi:hypothetical protein
LPFVQDLPDYVGVPLPPPSFLEQTAACVVTEWPERRVASEAPSSKATTAA